MYKKYVMLIAFSLFINTFTMEKITKNHPLIAAAAAEDVTKIADELEKLKHGYSFSMVNLLKCRNLEVASVLEENECNTFEGITYAALSVAIKNKKAHAALALLSGGPVCLHNNPGFLLHEAVTDGWPIDSMDKYERGYQQKRMIRAMIENGVLVTQKHPQTGKTPLEIAQTTRRIPTAVEEFLKEETKKYEEKVKNFKPYFREMRIPPYFNIVSYEDVRTLDDERRFQHYKEHGHVSYKPT